MSVLVPRIVERLLKEAAPLKVRFLYLISLIKYLIFIASAVRHTIVDYAFQTVHLDREYK